MFGFMLWVLLVTTPVGPSVCESEGDVYKNRYHPQHIIDARLMCTNHRCGTRDYEKTPWDKKAQYESVIEGSADSWMGHLKRTMRPLDFETWKKDMEWRNNCWNALDDFVNPWRYGYNEAHKLRSLSKLKLLLGPERFAAGWMPSPIPDTGDQVKWLQDLWTERAGYQGQVNAREGRDPLGSR